MIRLILIIGLAFLIFLFGAAYMCYKTGLIRRDKYDRNYVPERDDNAPMSPRASEYRRRAKEYNKWWNAQDLKRYEILSDDGLRLKAGYLPADKEEHKLAIVVHGHHCCAGEEGFISQMFHNAGFHVLAVDQRSHGASEGRRITMGYKESRDIKKWAELMAEEHPDCRMLLYGASMGGATVCMVSELDLPKQVVCIESDCAYTSARGVFEVEMYRSYNWLPCKAFILELSARMSELFGKFNFNDSHPEAAVSNAKVPMLFLQGTEDKQVPKEMAQRLYDAHPGKKKLLFFEKAGHNVSFFYGGEEYKNACISFFEECAALNG